MIYRELDNFFNLPGFPVMFENHQIPGKITLKIPGKITLNDE